MDSVLKAVLTAIMVLLVMAVARRGGRRWAGIAAALPTITAPTLAWLAYERGTAIALNAAIGSISACAMLAVFSLLYAHASRRLGRLGSVLCGLGGAVALAWPAYEASADLTQALMLSLVCSAVAVRFIPRGAEAAATRSHPPCSLAWASLVAGGLTALAATAGPALGGFGAGVLASLPVISAAVAMVEHTHGGHRAAASFLHSYAGGLFGKAAFGAIFVLLAPRLGVVTALSLALLCAGLMSLGRSGSSLFTWRSKQAFRGAACK